MLLHGDVKTKGVIDSYQLDIFNDECSYHDRLRELCHKLLVECGIHGDKASPPTM